MLILEDQLPWVDVCRMLLPHATVLHYPDFSLCSLPVILSTAFQYQPIPRPNTDGAAFVTEAFLRDHTSLLGLDSHCTPAQAHQGMASDLPPPALLPLFSLSTLHRFFLCTAPLLLSAHCTAALLSVQFSAWAPQLGWHPCSGLTSLSLFGNVIYASRWIGYAFLPGPHTASIVTSPSAVLDPAIPTLLLPTTRTHSLLTSSGLLFSIPTFPSPKPTPTTFPRCSAAALPFCFLLVPTSLPYHASSPTKSSGCTHPSPFTAAGPRLPGALLPCLTTGLPFSIAHSFAHHIFSSGIPSGLSTTSLAPLHCLSTNVLPVPTPIDWTQVYHADPDTARLLNALTAYPQPTWTAETISHVHKAYRPYLEANAVGMQGHFIGSAN